MADCGASGTVLDRVVAAATGGGGGTSSSASAASKQALASFVGHASMQGGTTQVAAMPVAPPSLLSTNSNSSRTTRVPVVVHHPSPELHRRPQLQPPPQPIAFCPTPQANTFTTAPPPPPLQAPFLQQHHHPPLVMQQQQHQQQQYMVMQQQQQMMVKQQQQQQMMLMQQQQQSTRLQTEDVRHVQDNVVVEEDDALTEHASNTHHHQQQQNQQQHSTLDDWHDGLEREVVGLDDDLVVEGHEGLTRGATIEELAAAWAQAESDYEDSVNLGAVYQRHDNEDEEATTTALYPYDFDTRQLDDTVAAGTNNRDWMKEAQEMFDRGDVVNAIACCETELQLGSEHNAQAWYLLGKCHAEQDEDTKAIACLERAVEMDPYSPPALLALGVSHVNELNHGRALEHLQNWMTHNPKYAGLDIVSTPTDNAVSDAYGSSTETETAFDQAQRLLLRAMEHDPSDPQVHEALGVVYNVSRDYDAAIASFRKALDLTESSQAATGTTTTSSCYSLWNKLGATLANANRSEEALPHYHSALQLRPRYARAWLNMAISHSNLKNYDEAARCYLQTLSLNPSARHCWSYLRIALSCAEKWDLIPLAARQDLSAFAEHYDFVQYTS